MGERSGQTGTLLIRSASVLTMNSGREVIRDGAVLVEAGRIAYVGPAAGAPRGAEEVIDASGKLVMPGLVNCHTHLCMVLGRTIGVERRLLGWLEVEMGLMRGIDLDALVAISQWLEQLLGRQLPGQV